MLDLKFLVVQCGAIHGANVYPHLQDFDRILFSTDNNKVGTHYQLNNIIKHNTMDICIYDNKV